MKITYLIETLKMFPFDKYLFKAFAAVCGMLVTFACSVVGMVAFLRFSPCGGWILMAILALAGMVGFAMVLAEARRPYCRTQTLGGDEDANTRMV